MHFGWGNWVKNSGSGGRRKWNGRAVAAQSTGGGCPGKVEPTLKDGQTAAKANAVLFAPYSGP